MSSFVHLHVHSEYSLLDGACRTKDLAKKAKKFEMPALALTDHGNLFGAIEFYTECKKAGVKPIIGCEVYLAPGSRFDKKASSAKEASTHFLLLAKDLEGYHNLLHLVTAAHLEGYYYKPRVDKELLAKHAKGLIGTSACLKSEINQFILRGQLDEAEKSIRSFKEIFAPGDFYLEIHNHGISEQLTVTRALRQFAKKLDLKLVAANDVHYVEKSHVEAHDVLLCIGTGAQLNDEKRMRYPSSEFYFKSAEEMSVLFSEIPEALVTTLEIAEKCNLEVELGVNKFPAYPVEPGVSRDAYLRELCEAGMQRRYGDRATEPELRDRLNYELSVLEKTGFTSYFLIVWDFIDYARRNGIPVGPGRGSAAGSIIAYVLNITDLDPIRYGLFFERFLNPERISPPDIDVDFCYNRRPEVIAYVKRKYGEKAVSQIITYGTLGAKMVLRDVARVMGMSYGEADRLAKMIPKDLNYTLNDATKDGKQVGGISMVPELKAAYDNEENARQVLDFCLPLEGLTRQVGVHAAGVVIADQDLVAYVPLTRDDEGNVVTQYSMEWLGEVGMLKMDFLGLKTLTVIQDAFDLIEQTTGKKISMEQIPIDDVKTYEMLQVGKTIGVFQLESGGMIDACRRIKPERIEDLIALVALYRPGPMEFIPVYAERKLGIVETEYPHPALEELLKETYGVMIYQEQVMKAASIMAGYTLGQADLLRRAMGKKKAEEMAKHREIFLKGCAELHKLNANKANEIFDILEKFAGYGFNKAHAACYGYLAYITAYLKANYSVQMMAALMSNDLNNTDKIAQYVEESKVMGLTIAPPHVNESGVRFTVSGNIIRFGLAAIKNAGEGAVTQIAEARKKGDPFKNLSDLCARVEPRVVNKKTLESLIKTGACDGLGETRAQMFSEIDSVLAQASRDAKDREVGQGSLLDLLGETPSTKSTSQKRNAILPEWPTRQRLGYEKELIGIYLSGHPLEDYMAEIRGLQLRTIAELATNDTDRDTRLAGILTKVEVRMSKENKPWARCTLEDQTGAIEVLAFNTEYVAWEKPFQAGDIVVIAGSIDRREEPAKLRVREMLMLETARIRLYQALRVEIPLADWTPERLKQFHEKIMDHAGPTKLQLRCLKADGTYADLEAKAIFGVEVNENFFQILRRDFQLPHWEVLASRELPKAPNRNGWNRNRAKAPAG